MILWLAIATGVVVGMGVSRWRGRSYHPPVFRHLWLVFAGFLPQFFSVYLGNTREIVPDWLVASSVVISQAVLLAFAYLNRQVIGMPVLMIGLVMNLAVIAANGGFMPIAPSVATRLVGPEIVSSLEPGGRFGFKDVLLEEHETQLVWFSDRLLLPRGFPYQVAFSLGDVFIAIGVFWMLANQKTIRSI